MRRYRLVRIAISTSAAAVLAGCRERVPVRLVVPSDTLVINSTDWTPLGIELLDAAGRPALARTVVRYQSIQAPALSISPDGNINCREDGVGRILIAVDTFHAQRPIRCHIARRFGGQAAVQLIAGGAPARFFVEAYDKDGKLIIDPRLRAVVRDTTILRFEHGLVYGLRAGASEIRVRSAGREGGQIYFVAAADTPPDSSAEARAARRR